MWQAMTSRKRCLVFGPPCVSIPVTTMLGSGSVRLPEPADPGEARPDRAIGLVTCCASGLVYYRQERYDFAEYHFRRALSINHTSSILKCYIGMALYANDRPQVPLPRDLSPLWSSRILIL